MERGTERQEGRRQFIEMGGITGLGLMPLTGERWFLGCGGRYSWHW